MPTMLIMVMIAFALVLSGCESVEEKAERVRLENLYALDNAKVVENYYLAGSKGTGYRKEYQDIQRECAKEELTKKGKWCEKFLAIQKIAEEREKEDIRKALQKPVF